MEKWIETRKGADFEGIASRFEIDPVMARIIRNREVITDEEIEQYLHGGINSMHDPHTMKDMDLAVSILTEKFEAGKKIRIIGDYDIDGVNATYILYKAFRRCGADVDYAIPDRMTDGYGINEHLIENARAAGVDTVVTCDNGIAALAAIAYGKEMGMTIVVTDHHEIPYEEKDGKRVHLRSVADAIINPKQLECAYPYKELCGAAVAYKLVQALYEAWGIPPEEVLEFLENAAFATIGDIMSLTGENRIIVKAGLERLHQTTNLGLQALISQNNLDQHLISPYHIGFVLGPCMNASGRLDTAEYSLKLLLAENEAVASAAAAHLIELNESRKALTQQQTEAAMELIEREEIHQDRVIVVYLPECHESLAGIIAGRIRERYYRPVFVLTKGEDGVKGSGRSVEEYSMFEEMNKVSQLITKFGGHPMAAGLSLAEEKVSAFRSGINEVCALTEEELTEKVRIDIALPIGYATTTLIEQLQLLEPFGKENTKPVFADRDVHIRSARVLGKNRNVLKLDLAGRESYSRKGVYFGDVDIFLQYLREKFGKSEVDKMLNGRGNSVTISIIYDLSIDDYNGKYEPQIIIRKYR